MKYIKKKLSKKQITSILLASVLAVVIAVSIPVGIVLNEQGNGKGEPTPPPEIIEGEALQNGLAVAYPSIAEKSQITFINIKNQSGEFGFIRDEGDSYLTMYYVDANGDQQPYIPPIMAEDQGVNYSDFFAIETSDGFSRYPKLDYLCLAVQTPYFAHRIELSSNAEERASQLKAYGLSDGEYSVIDFGYTDKETKEVKRISIKIGEQSVSGTGYYFIVGDRPYVYSSSNNYYDYAVAGYTDFVKALIVAPGLTEDKGFGPLLTNGYYQWKNEMHGTVGEEVVSDSRVIVYTDVISPVIKDDASFNGYYKESDLIEFDLRKLKENDSYRRTIAALVGAKNGAQTPNIVFTVTSPTNKISFGDASVKSYQYTITAIEAILTESGEITTAGVACQNSSDLIKVSYTATLDGKQTSKHTRHAVIDLSSAAIPEATVGILRAAPIGELAAPYTFTVDYTKDNSHAATVNYIITEIIAVYDSEGKKIEKATDTSIVEYRYERVLEGETLAEDTFMLDLSKVTDPIDVAIKELLVGRKAERGIRLEVSGKTEYSECFMGFATYSVSRIDYFITSTLISAFKFQNSSERDPYYGESLYENRMEDEHKLYGLNASVCERVVKILGGISDETASGTASGLTGDKVVAVGLTPEVLKEYGLYAHTIEFELPRSIYGYTSDKPSSSLYESLDDYLWRSTLKFTLYVSDEQVDTEENKKFRYIASDMYDIVTRVDAYDFVFLNYDFETFWARRNLMMMDVNSIESLDVEFNMSDLNGSYYFDLIHEIIQYQPSYGAEYEKFNKTTVSVVPSDKTQSNKLIAYMNEKGYAESLSLTELYEAVYGKDDPELKEVYPDSLGTAYFKEAMQMLFRMTYVDIMPEEDRVSAMKPEKMLMRIKLEVKSSSAYDYVYEFYRADDRRVVVSIYKADINGTPVTTPVSDFYISSFALKKIVACFNGLLNAEKIDPDTAYFEEK